MLVEFLESLVDAGDGFEAVCTWAAELFEIRDLLEILGEAVEFGVDGGGARGRGEVLAQDSGSRREVGDGGVVDAVELELGLRDCG